MVHATEARVPLPANQISDTLEMTNSTGLAATLHKFPPLRYMGISRWRCRSHLGSRVEVRVSSCVACTAPRRKCNLSCLLNQTPFVRLCPTSPPPPPRRHGVDHAFNLATIPYSLRKPLSSRPRQTCVTLSSCCSQPRLRALRSLEPTWNDPLRVTLSTNRTRRDSWPRQVQPSRPPPE